MTFRTGRNEEAGRKIQDIFKFFIFGPGQRQQCGHSAPEAAADVATVVAPVSPCRKAPSPNHPLHVFFSAPCLLFWLLGRRRLCKSEAQLSSAPECRTIKQLKVDKNKLQQPREPWQKERGIVPRKERALTIHKVQLHKSETSPQWRATRAPNNDNCNCSRSEREGNVGKGKRRH